MGPFLDDLEEVRKREEDPPFKSHVCQEKLEKDKAESDPKENKEMVLTAPPKPYQDSDVTAAYIQRSIKAIEARVNRSSQGMLEGRLMDQMGVTKFHFRERRMEDVEYDPSIVYLN